MHDAALMLVLKLPGLHGLQRALDVSVVFNSNVPGVHGCFASQYGWPTACWNFPAGQRSQATALLSSEKCIAAHAWHARLVVALGTETTRSPLAQTACVVHKPFPALLW